MKPEDRKPVLSMDAQFSEMGQTLTLITTQRFSGEWVEMNPSKVDPLADLLMDGRKRRVK